MSMSSVQLNKGFSQTDATIGAMCWPFYWSRVSWKWPARSQAPC